MFKTFSWIPTWSVFFFHSHHLKTNIFFCDLKDINSLVHNELPIQIPAVVVKWITTALVLHIAALIVAALSAFFGLLAHVREMSMTCCSTFISGFAAVIALVAFIFDLVLFFVAKARISSVGSAQIGSAVWLTLAAWVLLFFSGCFYSCGKNCISNRPSKKRRDDGDRDGDNDRDTPKKKRSTSYNNKERFNKERSDAVRAAEGRRTRKTELGLPDMPEVVETVPLTEGIEESQTAFIDGNEVRLAPPQGFRQQSPSGGYVPGARGTTAVDGYYNNRPQNTYPPNNPYPQNIYPTSNAYPPSNVYPPPNAYSTLNAYPPSQQFSVPSHTSSAAQSHYGSYSYTPSPPVPDGLSSCEPAYIPGEHSELTTYYPDISATVSGQHANYNPNPFGPSPSPHQDSLLDPPRPSALYSSIPSNQQSTLNRPTASPNIINSSPPPQQSLQRSYTLRDGNHVGQSGYTPGVTDYSLSNQSSLSQPTAVPVPSPPPLQNHQFGYTSGDGSYENRRPQPLLNPYVTQPSPSPQQRYSSGGADYGVSNQSTSSQPTAYVPSPPPLQNENFNREAGRSQRFSNPYVIHSSPPPEESHQGMGRGNHTPEGGGVDRDDPPVYTSMQN